MHDSSQAVVVTFITPVTASPLYYITSLYHRLFGGTFQTLNSSRNESFRRPSSQDLV